MDTRDEPDPSVLIRPSTPADRTALIAGRDIESGRFLGDGASEPSPAFCILVSGEVVGWDDFDTDRTWRLPGEVIIGYNVFPSHRAGGTRVPQHVSSSITSPRTRSTPSRRC